MKKIAVEYRRGREMRLRVGFAPGLTPVSVAEGYIHEECLKENFCWFLDKLFCEWACEIDVTAEGLKKRGYLKIVDESVSLGNFFGKKLNINPYKFTKIVYDEVKRRGGNV